MCSVSLLLLLFPEPLHFISLYLFQQCSPTLSVLSLHTITCLLSHPIQLSTPQTTHSRYLHPFHVSTAFHSSAFSHSTGITSHKLSSSLLGDIYFRSLHFHYSSPLFAVFPLLTTYILISHLPLLFIDRSSPHFIILVSNFFIS